MNTAPIQGQNDFDIFFEKLSKLPAGYAIRLLQNKETNLTVLLLNGSPVFWSENEDEVWSFALSSEQKPFFKTYELRFCPVGVVMPAEFQNLPLQRILEQHGYIVLDMREDQPTSSVYAIVDKIIEPLPRYLTCIDLGI